jgi:hypothetical protein
MSQLTPTQADRDPAEAAKVGGNAVLLHPRVDEGGWRAQGNDVGQLQRRDGDAARRA